ncbi:uncharacterized protein LOC112575486 isoform X2 [Pomacea canaliculata]|uniref:uncharacterized protein LOC112575486 isoform X2 n=1 Tax=Pomacea canaliculata TaxID=400727 RepID=UPI000D738A00|nr:uncharacterized protein LOC112575486 isoform X2 [Pomacea canaliculata]
MSVSSQHRKLNRPARPQSIMAKSTKGHYTTLSVSSKTSFDSKASKNELQLKSSLAHKLRTDIMRMKTEDVHTDLQFLGGTYMTGGHKIMLKCRTRGLIPESLIHTSDRSQPVIPVNPQTQDELRDLVEMLYTYEEVDADFIFSHLKIDQSRMNEKECNDQALHISHNHQKEVNKGELNDLDSSHETRTSVPKSADFQDIGESLSMNKRWTIEEVLSQNILTVPESHIVHTESQAVSALQILPIIDDPASPLLQSGEGDSLYVQTSNDKDLAHGFDNQVVHEESMKDDRRVKYVHDKTVSEEPTLLFYRPVSRLGADLLWGYLQRVDPDCCLQVEGERYPAHKCILAARCQYFNAMFTGAWSEGQEMDVELQGVRASSVHYLLLYLYGAMVEVPASDLVSVIQMSDMFGMEGLKELLAFQMSQNLCHFFHKPCQRCAQAVSDVLPIAYQYNLSKLFNQCLKWTAKHFRRVFEVPSFATLPALFVDECTKLIIEQMCVDNIIQIILDAHDLTCCLQQSRRAEHLQLKAARILDAAIRFSAANFPAIVHSSRFLSWSKGGAWCVDMLEESFGMAVTLMPVEASCDVYITLRTLLKSTEAQEEKTDLAALGGDEAKRLLQKLIDRCEWYIHRYIHHIMQCPGWASLSSDLQQDLLHKSCFVPVNTSTSSAKQPLEEDCAGTCQRVTKRTDGQTDISHKMSEQMNRRNTAVKGLETEPQISVRKTSQRKVPSLKEIKSGKEKLRTPTRSVARSHSVEADRTKIPASDITPHSHKTTVMGETRSENTPFDGMSQNTKSVKITSEPRAQETEDNHGFPLRNCEAKSDWLDVCGLNVEAIMSINQNIDSITTVPPTECVVVPVVQKLDVQFEIPTD